MEFVARVYEIQLWAIVGIIGFYVILGVGVGLFKSRKRRELVEKK